MIAARGLQDLTQDLMFQMMGLLGYMDKKKISRSFTLGHLDFIRASLERRSHAERGEPSAQSVASSLTGSVGFYLFYTVFKHLDIGLFTSLCSKSVTMLLPCISHSWKCT